GVIAVVAGVAAVVAWNERDRAETERGKAETERGKAETERGKAERALGEQYRERARGTSLMARSSARSRTSPRPASAASTIPSWPRCFASRRRVTW
ncbi:MAG: hypothetical protein H7138_19075, partial [Myxococcales bacterium]|nr:hypothetical protein [Myxococcales bacterium]